MLTLVPILIVCIALFLFFPDSLGPLPAMYSEIRGRALR